MPIDTAYIQSQAKLLAEYEVQRALAQTQRNEAKYKLQLEAVNALDTALKALASAVKGFKGTGDSMLVNAATFSAEGFASATVGANAKEGSYQFFVDQLATRHQVALGDMGTDAADGGNLSIKQGTETFAVDLSAADADGDGSLSQEELATAINDHPDNKGVKATLVRTDGKVTMVLTAAETGKDGLIELSTDATGSALEAAIAPAAIKELSKAQNAVVYMGADTNGMKLEQASNTFDDLIDGVSLTFSKVHQSGDEPLTVDISRDKTATKDKLNAFVTAINDLLGVFDSLTGAGGESGERGPLAGDSSVRSVESMINSVLRTEFGGVTLMEFGILAGADGKLQVDSKSFEKMLAADPEAFEKLFSDKGNLLDTLEKKLSVHTSGSTGSMKARKENLNSLLQRVDDKYADLETAYQAHYQRYLKQYTNMAQVMASMEQTFSMFG